MFGGAFVKSFNQHTEIDPIRVLALPKATQEDDLDDDEDILGDVEEGDEDDDDDEEEEELRVQVQGGGL